MSKLRNIYETYRGFANLRVTISAHREVSETKLEMGRMTKIFDGLGVLTLCSVFLVEVMQWLNAR